MNFNSKDFYLGLFSLVFTVTLAYGGCRILWNFPIPSEFKGIFILLAFLFLMILSSALLLLIIRRIVPLQEGLFILDDSNDAVAWKLQGFLYIFNLGLLINTYLVPVNMRSIVFKLLGAKIGKVVMIGGKILEPPLVEIGDHSMLGEDSLITAHSVVGDKVILGKIKIGRNVTIGAKAIIFPGVEIGDQAVVAAGSVVILNTIIPPREIWAGNPAKKVKFM